VRHLLLGRRASAVDDLLGLLLLLLLLLHGHFLLLAFKNFRNGCGFIRIRPFAYHRLAGWWLGGTGLSSGMIGGTAAAASGRMSAAARIAAHARGLPLDVRPAVVAARIRSSLLLLLLLHLLGHDSAAATRTTPVLLHLRVPASRRIERLEPFLEIVAATSRCLCYGSRGSNCRRRRLSFRDSSAAIVGISRGGIVVASQEHGLHAGHASCACGCWLLAVRWLVPLAFTKGFSGSL
jgi:hypothetical protein